MKLNKQYGTISISIFILFLGIVFILFAFVNNAFDNVSTGRRILIDVLFLFNLAIGSLLFYLGEKKLDWMKTEQKSQQQTDHNESDTLIIEKEVIADQIADDKEIDLKNIIPSSSQSFEKFAEALLKNLADEFKIVQGLFYFRKAGTETFQCRAQYAYYSETKPVDFKLGETLPGQAVKNKRIVAINKIPENYFVVVSGLGKGAPREIVFLPINFEGRPIALIEYASFGTFDEKQEKNLNLIAEKVAEMLVKLSKK